MATFRVFVVHLSSDVAPLCRLSLIRVCVRSKAPHALCEATNLRVDSSKASHLYCPKHRPGYNCIGADTFHGYAHGAFSGCCALTDPVRGALDPAKFPKDHFRDIFEVRPDCVPLELPSKNLPKFHRTSRLSVPFSSLFSFYSTRLALPCQYLIGGGVRVCMYVCMRGHWATTFGRRRRSKGPAWLRRTSRRSAPKLYHDVLLL
jgi:hypothetical protein